MGEPHITILTSMATRHVLGALAGELSTQGSCTVAVESAGGVEVARRIREGATGDLAVLAAGSLKALASDGFVLGDTVHELFRSQVVAAVAANGPSFPFDTVEDLRRALLRARRVAYSTGPSGTELVALVDRLGLATEVGERLLQAPPGVPVGELLSRGDAELGFQQRSELLGMPGVDIIGPLPADTAITSTFSVGVLAGSPHGAVALEVLGGLTSPGVSEIARAHGLELVT